MIKKIVACTILIIISTYSFAQKTNSSPYSFFGIGDQAKIKSVEEIAMGQMGGVLDSEYHLSFTNPASYASFLLTTYVFAAGNKSNHIDDGTNKQSSSTAGLTYIALGIPIMQNQGLAFGMQLNTTVGYSLLESFYNEEDILAETNLLSGDGGTNRIFLGYGRQFPIGLNLGAEVAYIFGGIDNSIVNRRLNVQLATKHETNSYIKGFTFKLGAQYIKNISPNLKLKFGTTFELPNDLNENGDQYLYSMDNNINQEFSIPRDTLLSEPYKATIESPLRTILSAGVGEDNKWFVGAEYTFQDAIKFNGPIYDGSPTYNYLNSSAISLGGFFTPKYNSISSYWNRITYRAGVNYKKLGLVVNDTQIDDYGMSFGVSLPMGLSLSNINLGFELGKRGTTDNDLIKENYYNFRLSISLNDKWFYKNTIK